MGNLRVVSKACCYKIANYELLCRQSNNQGDNQVLSLTGNPVTPPTPASRDNWYYSLKPLQHNTPLSLNVNPDVKLSNLAPKYWLIWITFLYFKKDNTQCKHVYIKDIERLLRDKYLVLHGNNFIITDNLQIGVHIVCGITDMTLALSTSPIFTLQTNRQHKCMW